MKIEATATLDEAGRLELPQELRQALGARAGTKVVLHLETDGVHIRPAASTLAQAQRLVRSHVARGRSLADELIAERRRSAEHE